MADDFFPGFAEDEGDPKPKKAAPKGGPAPAGFDPFADQQVDVNAPAATPAAAPAPAAPAPAQAPATAPKQGFDAFAGQKVDSNADEEPDDPELKPGSRKDLWKCPHCGAGNRPNRDSCRVCGKKPSDPVAKPWFQNPVVLGGVGGALVLVILAVVFLSGPSFGLSPAKLGSIDEAARVGSGGGSSLELAGETWTPSGPFAACGRVVSAGEKDGNLHIVLGFGKRARALEEGGKISDQGGSEVGVAGVVFNTVPYARLTVVAGADQVRSATQGQVLSLSGTWGALGDLASRKGSHSYVIMVERAAVADP